MSIKNVENPRERKIARILALDRRDSLVDIYKELTKVLKVHRIEPVLNSGSVMFYMKECRVKISGAYTVEVETGSGIKARTSRNKFDSLDATINFIKENYCA